MGIPKTRLNMEASTVACYLRVSTSRQRVAGQESAVRQWLNGQGLAPDSVRWYDDRESGATTVRPEFERLQQDVFQGRVTTIVVWRLDRLSRRLKDGVEILSDWLERGVRVVAVTQAIDFSGAVGRMLAAVLLGLAEIELEARAERQAVGIEAAKRRGVYQGRKLGTTKADPERARALRRRGLKPLEIGRALGVSRATVFKYLKSTEASPGDSGRRSAAATSPDLRP